MTIRRRLTLRFTLATMAVLLASLGAVYIAVGRCDAERLRLMLCALFALALLALALCCFLLVRAALRPLEDIAGEMEQISADHIERRLPLEGKPGEIGELSEAFNALLDRLETSFTSQKMFVSNVSHELRTPLATIIGSLDLALQRGRSEGYYRQVISAALGDAWQMSSLIDGLLDLAKADYEEGQVKMERIRLDEILIDARESILRAHPDYRIELLFGTEEADDDSRISVMGNVYLLKIAFANLMENNCKYSRNKTSFVQISFWGGQSTVLFSDNGMGMSEQEKESLFNLFYRGERAREAEGHGIGMTLAQKIVDMHQGHISVHSEQGEGTTFLVQLRHL